MGKRADVKIGLYMQFNGAKEFYAESISGVSFNRIMHPDKYLLGFTLRNFLNSKKINKCTLFPMKNSHGEYIEISDLEMIASAISFSVNGIKTVKINYDAYDKK